MTSWMLQQESIQGACGSCTLRVSLLTRDFCDKSDIYNLFSLLRAGVSGYPTLHYFGYVLILNRRSEMYT